MRSRAGFTLIEIMVTLSIMAIIFSIAANGFNRMNSKSNLKSASELLVSDIRSTALMAVNSEQFQLQSPAGWGIYFDGGTGTYTIFADLDGGFDYDNKEKFRTVTLSRNIALLGLSFNFTGTPSGSLFFTAVTAAPRFGGLVFDDTTGDFGVQLIDNISSEIQDISVNSLGTVSLE